MNLAPGHSVGPYRIVAPIGAGGMGEVYRARDTKLGRDVALKILPDAVANDPERLARFEREAKTLASLNHPHIAQIYGFEDRALAMELVDGEDLSQRIARGPIPLEEALPIARQIAEALEAAHEQGIIHRDLKPANIKVRGDGTVKVLDFGLAKLGPAGAASAPHVGNVLSSPTITSPAAMTVGGMILGTAAYMAPEQARGKPVDKRADIWAFGVVLYEMLAGARLFQGNEVSDVLAAVLRHEPDWKALPADTPDAVVRLLMRCLERDPKRRLRDIGDALADLSDQTRQPPRAVDDVRRRGTASAVFTAIAVPVAALIAGAAAWTLKPSPTAPPAMVVRASYPIGAPLSAATNQRPQLAISPDGQYIATIVGCCVSLRRVDQLTATVIEGSEGALGVFFSPDSQWAGFWTAAAIKKSPVTGGGTSTIGDHGISVYGGPVGVTWADNGLLYYGTLTGISRMPANGGRPETVLVSSELTHPHALPGSRGLLLTRGATPAAAPAGAEAVLYRFDGGDPISLTPGANPRFTSTGHLLVARGNDLFAAPLNLSTGRLTGEPVAVAQQVAMLGGFSQFDVSRTGTLIYIPGAAANQPRTRLARVTGTGTLRVLPHPNRGYSDPRISPDGRQVALHLMDQQDDIWIAGVSGGALTRMSFRPLEDETPAWSPDGAWIAFAGWGADPQTRHIWRRRADGRGDEETLWSGKEHIHVTDWAPDGKSLVFEVQRPESRGDLHVLELGPPHQTRVFLQTPFDETSGRVSPDGHWLAYRSNESGQSEIFVQSFPAPGARVQVSTDGGLHPVWSRDGRDLYFRSPTEVMRARVLPGATFAVEPPVSLFKDTFARPQGESHTTFDVLPGGDFLFLEPVQAGDLSSQTPVLIGVFNWFSDLRARVDRATP